MGLNLNPKSITFGPRYGLMGFLLSLAQLTMAPFKSLEVDPPGILVLPCVGRAAQFRARPVHNLLTMSGELVMCQEILVQEVVDTLLDNGTRG